MLSNGHELFIETPNEKGERLLHPAKVTERNGDHLVAEFCAAAPPQVIDAGTQLTVYFMHGREFMKQAAQIDAIMETEPRLLFGCELLGKAVSAESRECFRVSTMNSDLTIAVGDDPECAIADISATGFSAISAENHRHGTILAISLELGGVRYVGRGSVQSIRDVGQGRTRYGFLAIDERRTGDSLMEGLQKLSLHVQREQLKRLSATG